MVNGKYKTNNEEEIYKTNDRSNKQDIWRGLDECCLHARLHHAVHWRRLSET